MGDNMELRTLDPKKDFAQVKEVFESAFSREPWNDDWSDRRQLDLYIQDLLDQKNTLAFGLFDNDALVGIALGRLMHFYEGNQFRIDELCIKPGHQGKGLGTLLLDRIGKACIEKKIAYLILTTERNYPAYSFYCRNGFQSLENSVMLAKKLF